MTISPPTSLLNPKRSYLLGHRGARGEKLENSISGFTHLQRLHQRHSDKLVGVEFDVQLTADNKLLVYHDDNLLRLHQRQSRLDQCSSSELMRQTQDSDTLILLEDMASYLTGYQRIELEIKTHSRSNYRQLMYALRQALVNTNLSKLPITLTSFDLTLHQHLLTDTSLKHLPRGLLVEPKSMPTTTDISNLNLQTVMSTNAPLLDTALIAKRLGCQGVGLYFALFNPALIYPHPFSDSQSAASAALNTQRLMHSLQRHQLTTTAWTVNESTQVQQLIKLGINYIISDYPSRLLPYF
ncbi:glycerophosphodiester phosphodiesterase [Psychrobacter lutiphocae]|uniref:glycerophosphodiester phosphodiesterase n=1 Tax=Psychrobacter lutiphocae TaxID=540500 RepID=UPI00035E4119|nr:glycerophosphodiester phosphodiesterase [Psychrobacter lutiphocae]